MKVQRISQFQSTFTFPNFESDYAKLKRSFDRTELGQIHMSLPWKRMVRVLGLKDARQGPQSIFSPQGKLALMFLKHYCCCSDHKLIEQLNGNIYYQIFCDIWLGPGNHISNFKIVSEIRCEIAKKLDIDKLQGLLCKHWKPFMQDLHSITCDATCYESGIRYPTDVKLLWEAVHWTYIQLKNMTKQAGVRMLRSKIVKWTKRYTSYSKMKRKTKKKRRALTRGLIRLLTKLNTALSKLEKSKKYKVVPTYKQRRLTIGKILKQQSVKFYEEINPSQRIVSIDKPYIRPIVRGKEVKKVEFGAKVHKLQIDGISFIEHLSYEAFNEGTRLDSTIFKAQQLTHSRVKIVGADAIYATNRNRKMVTKASIQTDFKKKGRKGRHEKHRSQISKMITKERASRLEGSFGTDKEYYLLNRIKARTQATETLWIFIGIHTSNALKIGRRMSNVLAKAA